MRRSGKVGITVLMMFAVFIVICVAMSTSESQPELDLEELGNRQLSELHLQCYATNETDKTWKGSVQMRIYRLNGSILHSSSHHIWVDVTVKPGERTYYAAKVKMPREKQFIVEWEWGGQKIRTKYTR